MRRSVYAVVCALIFAAIASSSGRVRVLAQSCEGYAYSCVLWLRCARIPSLPTGLNTLAQKRAIINSPLASRGEAAIMDTGIPEGHIGYVAAVREDAAGQAVALRLEEANYVKETITMTRQGTPTGLHILGFFNSGGASSGRPDLVAIKQGGTSSGKAEIHISSQASGYAAYALQAATPQPVEAGVPYQFAMTDWDLGGRIDLIALKKSGTGSGNAEVHVTSGESLFSRSIFDVATIQPIEVADWYDLQLADWNRDGVLDLIAIKKAGTSTGKVEVHVTSGAGNFQSYLAHIETAEPVPTNPASTDFRVTDWDHDGRPDLFVIRKAVAGRTTVQLSVLSAGSGLRQYVLNASSVQPVESGVAYQFALGDIDRDGSPDLVSVKLTGTSDGHAELHVASGASSFASYLLNTRTVQPVEDARWYAFDLKSW
jgi:FG-GAP-like repeat